MEWVKRISLGIGIAIIMLTVFIIQPWVYLPHKRIVVSLPFAPNEDADVGLIPMGEKIEHPNIPSGHPGIDFGFSKPTNIVASFSGKVTKLYTNEEGTKDIEITNGYYKAVYKELNTIDPSIHKGNKVEKGDVLGVTGRDHQVIGRPKPEDGSGQVHWEFASTSMILDRLCPIGYFDADSRTRIETIWARVPNSDRFKSKYPDICSGDYKGKED